jgi:hypothetical protein
LRAIGFADFADFARLGATLFLAALGAVLRDLGDAFLVDFFGLATCLILLLLPGDSVDLLLTNFPPIAIAERNLTP